MGIYNMTKNFSVVIKQNGQQMTNYMENIRASGIKQGFKKLLTKYPELDNHNIDIVLSNEKGRYKYVHSDNKQNTSKTYITQVMIGTDIDTTKKPTLVKATSERTAIAKLVKNYPSLTGDEYFINIKQKGGKRSSVFKASTQNHKLSISRLDYPNLGFLASGRPVVSDLK